MCVPYLTYKFACSTFETMFFRFYIIDCSVSFDSHIWTQKSDIIRASYEVFHLLTRSCVCIPHLWHKFAFPCMPHSTFKITFFRFYIIDCCVNFDSHVWTQKSDIIRASYEVFHLLTCSCACIAHLWHKFTFLSCRTPKLSKSHFLDFIS